MKKEKEQLEQKVHDEEVRRVNLASPPKTTTVPLTKPFHPQRHSPISLDSLNVKLQPPFSASPNSTVNKPTNTSQSPPCHPTTQKRDVSQMTTAVLTRDIGITTNQLKTRTTAVNTDQKHYTKQELQAAIDLTIEKQQLEQLQIKQAQQQNLISVGTQMHPVTIPSKQTISTCQQTQIESQSVAIQTRANQKSIEISCHPETRSIGISDNTTIEEICRKCSGKKRTIGCGPDEEPSLISLKLMDATTPKRSLTFSLGDGEKLNIARKSIGTQYSVIVPKKIDSFTQHIAPIMKDKQCQQSVLAMTNQHTDTLGLLERKNRACATEPIQEVKKLNAESNTESRRTESVSTNTNAPLKQLDHSTNTVRIQSKDVACGVAVKPHILISCADNYCDTCKDTIMHLAKGFTKGSNGGGNGGLAGVPIAETSRIPRPTTLMSPRTERKFMRQNTYTLPSSDESPIEQQVCPAEMFLR